MNFNFNFDTNGAPYYRASRQVSIKFLPYYTLFQKEMRLPIHNEVHPGSGGSDVVSEGGEARVWR